MKHKNLKRILAFAMMVLMTATLLPSYQTVQAGTRNIPAKSIQLAKKTLTLNVGKTARIKAKTKPANAADKKLFYSSKNKAVATVNKKGKVTAVSEGTTKILVFTKDKTLKKKVTVHVTKPKDPEAVSSRQIIQTEADLTDALKKTPETIRFQTEETLTFTIPEGDYPETTLILCAPNASITNEASFKEVILEKIASHTYIEKSKKGNKLTVNAPDAHIKNEGLLDLIISGNAQNISLTNNGNVKKLDIRVSCNVSIDGSSETATDTTVSAAASIKTSLPLHLDAEVKFQLFLGKGAEATTITAVSKETVPEIKSEILVKIPLTIVSTKETSEIEVKPETQDTNKTPAPSTGGSASSSSGDSSSGSSSSVNSPVKKDLSYTGYELKWQDDFNGTSLNREDWNVETHEAGWVNSELQEYVDSDKNIYVKDGNLIIKPWKTGTGTYTSGRINTQGRHDFKYGLFEARVKVPKGKGFLPAFWMMPTDENLYGQWPRCGEIDCMEVMGQETDKVYGTIHFGNPHSEKQNTYTLENGDFADEYHVFSCEWEPGKITWYVDGIKFHEADDWYSTTEGQGTVAYPAPFDQNFYMILNLAVGGSWVGNPDANEDYVDGQQFTIDYVKAYQKTAGYDESNVKKPEAAPVVIPDPDVNGNYVHNGDFSASEALDDDKDWKFLTANEGEGSAKIQNNEIVIETSKEGTVDYSIQLVQPLIPAEEAAEYEISFDAYADEAREMYVGISAPERGWKKYFGNQKAALTTTSQTFTYSYTMTDKTDAAARLEFNMGHTGSIAAIHITNVSIKKIKQGTIDTSKKCLSDGNYIYNGSFQEGDSPKGLAYWNISGQMNASATSLEDGRRLKAEIQTAGASIFQEDLALTAGTALELSFDAEAAGSENELLMNVAGLTQTTAIAATKKHYTFKFTPEILENRNFSLTFQKPGTVLLDNIRLVEDTLIKNGKFDAGMSGFEVYVADDADANYVIDSLNEKNALDFTIKKTSDAEWKIQLKQNNVTLEKDQYYRLSFDIKSSINRKFQYAIQRNGAIHKNPDNSEDWTPYVQNTETLTAYNQAGEYTHISKEFKMAYDTDEGSIFNIALGGGKLTGQHRVCIDNIVLEKIDASEMPEEPDPNEPGDNTPSNLIKNGTFDSEDNWYLGISDSAADHASAKIENHKAIFTLNSYSDASAANWHIQLKQEGIRLETGKTYELTFTARSAGGEKAIKLACMDATNTNWYVNGDCDATLTTSTETYTFKISVGDTATDTNAYIALQFAEETVGCSLDTTVEISNVSLKEAT